VASEARSRAADVHDNEDVPVFLPAVVETEAGGAAGGRTRANLFPSQEEVTCCAVAMVTTSAPRPIFFPPDGTSLMVNRERQKHILLDSRNDAYFRNDSVARHDEEMRGFTGTRSDLVQVVDDDGDC